MHASHMHGAGSGSGSGSGCSTQATVALQVRLTTGLALASQPSGSIPASHGGGAPSDRKHETFRSCVDDPSPHSDGQLPNAVVFQLYGSDTTQPQLDGIKLRHTERLALVQSTQVWHTH